MEVVSDDSKKKVSRVQEKIALITMKISLNYRENFTTIDGIYENFMFCED